MKFNSSPNFNTLIALFILSSITLSTALFANTADWAMVNQFDKQIKLANEGNVKAMYDVGKLYERGRGVNQNITAAAQWFQKAASTKYAAAQARLGVLYFEGRGVKQNYKKALQLLHAAADKNIPSALFQLALMYELGVGVSQNLLISISWYQKADKFGYYLAKARVKRLKNLLTSKGNVQQNKTTTTNTNDIKTTAPLIQVILKGRWLKRKKPVGYLPSLISNCTYDSYNAMHCISTSQERSTGIEVITYNTDSIVTAKNKKSFIIVYTNNVLEVALLDEVVDGDGEIIEKSTSRIKIGQQGKKRTLTCSLKSSKTITCKKSNSTFNLISQ